MGSFCADTLIADGFEQCKADPFIFRKIVDGVVVLINGVYVDDLLVGGSQEDFKPLLLSRIQKFPTNDLGECTWYDGCGIERNAGLGTIKLSLGANVESLMTRFDAHTTSNTPASPGTDLGSRQNDESGGYWPVKKAVGSLLWLSTMTRPGITNIVRAVAPYAYTPTERLWRTTMKIDVDCAISETETLRVRNVVDATRCCCFFCFFWVAWLRAGEGIGWLAAGTMPNSLYRMPLVYLSLTCVFCYSCSFLFVVCVFVFFFALIGAW